MNPMNQDMKMVGALLPENITTENVVSEFVEKQFDIMFPGVEDVAVLKVLAIDISNKNPNAVLQKMVGFSNSVAAFVAELQNGEESVEGSSE